MFKSFLVYGMTSGLSKFISLLLIPIYTRVFTPDYVARLDVIQSFIMIMAIFGVLQLENSIQRYYYSYYNFLRKIMISSTLLTVSFLSVLILFLIVLFSEKISFLLFKNFNNGYLIAIGAIIIPLFNISSFNSIILRYQKKSYLFAITTLLQILLGALLTIYFVLSLELGIIGVFYGQILAYALTIPIQIISIKNDLTFGFSTRILKKMFQFAVPQFPARLGSVSNSYISRFFILGILSAHHLGIYSVALKFASVMQIFLSAFIMTWIPYMYENLKNKKHKDNFKQIFIYTLIFVNSITIIISLFSKEIFILFTTEGFYEAQFLLPGLVYANGLMIIKSVVDIGPMIVKKMIYSSYIFIVSGIINVLILYFGLIYFDLNGAVYSLVFANLILVFLNWYCTEKLYPIGFNFTFFISLSFITLTLIILLTRFSIAFKYRFLIALLIILMLFLYMRKNNSFKLIL